MSEKPLHSLLIVENNDQGKLYIIEDKHSKTTVEKILENPVESEANSESDFDFPLNYSFGSSEKSSEDENLVQSEFGDLINSKGLENETENPDILVEFRNDEVSNFGEKLQENEEKCDGKASVESFSCKYCDSLFESAKKLKKHDCPYLINGSSKDFLCRFCNKSLSKKSFQYHMSTHNSPEDSIGCEVCQKKFKNSRLLSLHSTIHSGKKPHKCEHCEDKSFLTKQQLVRHMAIHGIPAPLYNCDLCSKTFSYKHYLTLHLNMHSGNPIFKCKDCKRAFERKDYLKEHYMTAHSDQKNYSCEICMKSFKLKKYLKRHQTIHETGNRNVFICHICMKSLSGQKQLENHLMLHTGERNHTCDICGRTFITKSALTNHKYNHQAHPNPAHIKCTFCDKYFSRESDLKRHISTHPNQKPHKCFYCTKSYLHKNQLERHMCLHTGDKPKVYQCEICQKKLTQRYYLNQHMLTKHSGEFKCFCPICNKGFAAQPQLNRHSKVCSNRQHKKNEKGKVENFQEVRAEQRILLPQYEPTQIHVIQGDQIIIQAVQDVSATGDLLIL